MPGPGRQGMSRGSPNSCKKVTRHQSQVTSRGGSRTAPTMFIFALLLGYKTVSIQKLPPLLYSYKLLVRGIKSNLRASQGVKNVKVYPSNYRYYSGDNLI